MKTTKNYFLAVLTVLFIASCSKDEVVVDKPLGAYQNGILVLNEGGSGSGSTSFLKGDLSAITKDTYKSENSGDELGKYAQSIFFNGDYAYIISGGSNKITIVNRKTFKVVNKIETGLKAPRYGVVVNGKAYVTNANTYSYSNPATGNTDDYVSVINLSTNTIESTINLNATADKLVAYNNKLYIIEPYNNSKLLIVDLSNNTVNNSTAIGTGANSLEIKDGILYVLRANEIVKLKLSDNTVTTSALDASIASAKNLDLEGTKLYFTDDNKVFSGDIATLSVNTTPLITYTSTSAYGKAYGFAVINDKIYIGDGADFATEGKVYVYSNSGTLLKEYGSGIAPNSFYYNN